MPNVSNPLLGHSLEDTLALIKRKACSVTELTGATLDAFDVIGTELNAVARTEREAALAQATQLDRLNAAEAQRRPLFGAVLAHKDLYSRKDWELRAGSSIVHGAAEVTAAPLKKLDRAGAVDCARLNTVEFALGVTGHNSITGDVKNPWNPVHLPGGSSSGSAAAVAAGIVPAALGSDTGGSVRIPAAACGLVGLKPTAGLVGRSGVFPLSFSLDTVGPLTRTVRDNALVLRTIAGHDVADPASIDAAIPDYLQTIEGGVVGLRIGVPQNYFFDVLDEPTAVILERVRKLLAGSGAQIKPVQVEHIEHANRLCTLIIAVEGAGVHRDWLQTRAADYGAQTRARLMTGLYVPAEAYVRALDFRLRFMRHALSSVFREVDVLLVPMLPRIPPTLAEFDLGSNPAYAEMVVAFGRCSRPFNMLGFPAISLPCGFADTGLPVAMQLVARPFEEALLLRAARAVERELDLKGHVPAVSVWR